MVLQVNEVGYLPSGQQLLVTTGRGSVEVRWLCLTACFVRGGDAASCIMSEGPEK